jgi:hypothetical protein
MQAEKVAKQVALTVTEKTCQAGRHNYLCRPGLDVVGGQKRQIYLPLRYPGAKKLK